MRIAILKETRDGESRVAATPDSVKKFIQWGAQIVMEKGAGERASLLDAEYEKAGATLVKDASDAIKGAEIILTVRGTTLALPQGSVLIGMLSPYEEKPAIAGYAKAGITAFSLEMLPRISRAQSMDVLSSQSNLAGYRAVIEGVTATGKVVPMMMTAAGTIAPAKTLVLGAGVAGLQAIATAKRLGAVVSAFDVRPVVKEQVESLGAKFVEVPAEENAETKGGYAKEMSEEYKKKQSALIHDTIIKQDIVISTALIPGKPAPVLITEEMVKGMKPGSVIVDLAAASGGNCPLTEADKVVVKHGVTLIGYTNLPSHCAQDASSLYARNLFNFVDMLIKKKDGKFEWQWEDELTKGTLMTKGGEIVHAGFK